MVRMQSLYVSRKKACVYSGNLNLIYFGSMANNTVCVSVFEIHRSDIFHCLKQVLLQAEYLPHHTRIMPLGGQAAQMKLREKKCAWYGHSEKLNYNCHLFSLTGLNCTWCAMAPALLEIALNDPVSFALQEKYQQDGMMRGSVWNQTLLTDSSTLWKGRTYPVMETL